MFIQLYFGDLDAIPIDAVALPEKYIQKAPEGSPLLRKGVVSIGGDLYSKDSMLACSEALLTDSRKHKYKAIAIPISDRGLDPKPGFFIDFIIGVLNQESAFLDLFFYPIENSLQKIYVTVDNQDTYDSVKKRLAVKAEWSRARKLSFLIDCLDHNSPPKEVCNDHFIHRSNYAKFLKKFSEESTGDLLRNAEGKLFIEFGSDAHSIMAFLRCLGDLSTSIRKIPLSKVRKLSYDVFGYRSDWLTDTAEEDLSVYDPMFIHLKELIPDDKWHENALIKRGMASTIRRGKGLTKTKSYEIESDIVYQEYHDLLNLVTKIRELKQYTPWPIDLLEDFYGQKNYLKIIFDIIEPHQLVLDLMTQYYVCKPGKIVNIVFPRNND